LKERALPNLPLVVHVAPVIVPFRPAPDASAVVAKDPSLKVYAATSPLGTVQALFTVIPTPLLVAVSPTPSVALALNVCEPFVD
jgi:hypothetical protein